MVALAGRDAIGTWAQLEVLMAQWRRIEDLLDSALAPSSFQRHAPDCAPSTSLAFRASRPSSSSSAPVSQRLGGHSKLGVGYPVEVVMGSMSTEEGKARRHRTRRHGNVPSLDRDSDDRGEPLMRV